MKPHVKLTVGVAAAVLAVSGWLTGCRQAGDQTAERVRTPREDSVYLDSLGGRRKEYERGRAEACKAVYEGEKAAFSNAVDWQYDNEIDGCYVIFKYDPPLSEAQCDSLHPPAQTTYRKEWLLCHEGRFRTRY